MPLWEGNISSHVHLSVCMSVSLSTRGSHVTITHNALDFTIQPPFLCLVTPSPLHGTLIYRDQGTWDLVVQGPLLMTSGDKDWRPVQTCSPQDLSTVLTSGGKNWRPVQTYSPQDPPPSSANIWWLLRHVCLAQLGGTHPTGMLSCISLYRFSVFPLPKPPMYSMWQEIH